MEQITITSADQYEQVNWLQQPVFEFDDEAQALMTLQALREDLEGAREQVRHTMRWMDAAVRAAKEVANPQSIIAESGLARQTVYNMLGKDEAPEE